MKRIDTEAMTTERIVLIGRGALLDLSSLGLPVLGGREADVALEAEAEVVGFGIADRLGDLIGLALRLGPASLARSILSVVRYCTKLTPTSRLKVELKYDGLIPIISQISSKPKPGSSKWRAMRFFASVMNWMWLACLEPAKRSRSERQRRVNHRFALPNVVRVASSPKRLSPSSSVMEKREWP